ncbi:MAG: CinA family protein [Betaproteobacteria bacterium]|nr:CinA family protein [Betaproteobacteria bacterium]
MGVFKISDTHQSEFDLAKIVGDRLSQRGWMLVTAESCTGGWAGQAVTAVPGSSDWYERGYITYSNNAKCEMLGVQQATLDRHGAVSPQTAQEMATGALTRSHAQISVSITGIAGPDGGTATKPVGTVCFAWATQDGLVQQETHYFTGDRESIRRQAVATALQGILRIAGNATTIT